MYCGCLVRHVAGRFKYCLSTRNFWALLATLALFDLSFGTDRFNLKDETGASLPFTSIVKNLSIAAAIPRGLVKFAISLFRYWFRVFRHTPHKSVLLYRRER